MKINRRCKKSLHKNKKFNVVQIKISKQLAHEVILRYQETLGQKQPPKYNKYKTKAKVNLKKNTSK